MHTLVLRVVCISQHTQFELSSCTNSKDMIWGKILKTGHVTLTIREVVCHRQASTWYSLSNKMWPLSLHPFRRNDCGRRNHVLLYVASQYDTRVLSSIRMHSKNSNTHTKAERHFCIPTKINSRDNLHFHVPLIKVRYSKYNQVSSYK